MVCVIIALNFCGCKISENSLNEHTSYAYKIAYKYKKEEEKAKKHLQNATI